MAGENWTFWLNMTNLALGIITILALLLVFGAVGWDLLVRTLHKVHAPKSAYPSDIDAELQAMLHGGSHSLSVPGLGLTMADGGERVDPTEPESSGKKTRK